MLVAMGKKFQVADHDFTKFTLTPSVSMIIDIPSSIEDTFYVGIKENAFEPSSPCCRTVYKLQVDNSERPNILLCDGGPDHRVTYLSVQMSIINIFWLVTMI